jgi:hypothetical protein
MYHKKESLVIFIFGILLLIVLDYYDAKEIVKSRKDCEKCLKK